MNKITRIIALPLVSAGILGGALGLGLAGAAGAAVSSTTTNGSHAIVATPDKQSHNPVMHTWHQRHRHHNNFWRH
ncbi:hypothetical protein ACNUDN_04250 [Mycobacterium sp. smrl_JER01]|uniref:hypothetical protein n=1 Tax=Mycobacterium sp. smrl_JER01 TaxID=3402633 RepID=UPI003ACCDC7D